MAKHICLLQKKDRLVIVDFYCEGLIYFLLWQTFGARIFWKKDTSIMECYKFLSQDKVSRNKDHRLDNHAFICVRAYNHFFSMADAHEGQGIPEGQIVNLFALVHSCDFLSFRTFMDKNPGKNPKGKNRSSDGTITLEHNSMHS